MDKKALKIYQDFYGFDPGKIDTVRIPELDGLGTTVCLGTAKRLDYVSDKWERPDDHYYFHEFEKKWKCLTDKNGRFILLIPWPYKGKRIVRPEGVID